jgi:enoyl-CoA hydratase
MERNDDFVLYERRGRVAVITLNRPPANALSIAMYQALGACIDRLNADEHVHAAVMASSSPRIFCAGADIKEMIGLTYERRLARHAVAEGLVVKLGTAALPIVCAVGGAAVGGGSVIPSLCDHRIAAGDSYFGFPEISRGTVVGGGVFLRRLGVRPSLVREYLYSGRRIEVDEAFKVGLVDQVVPRADLMATAMAFAERIAVNERIALVHMKRAILLTEAIPDWKAAYHASHTVSAEFNRDSAASQASMAAFLAKDSGKKA